MMRTWILNKASEVLAASASSGWPHGGVKNTRSRSLADARGSAWGVRQIVRTLCLALIMLPLMAQERETVHKAFSGGKSIEVNNVFGSIRVAGYDGPEIQVEANKTITADDSERAEAAKREVKLDMTQTGGDVRLYVDGPFRCQCDDRPSFRTRNNVHEHGRRGYKVVYDFEIKVPRNTALYLGAVNEGKIEVAKTAGDYDIENINGSVQMDDVAGSGHVYALNGKVTITFVKNPEHDSYFGSLNGAVEAWFQPALC